MRCLPPAHVSQGPAAQSRSACTAPRGTSAPEVPPFTSHIGGQAIPFPPTSFRPRPPLLPPAEPPLAVPGCGRPRAVAASRTMSPSRASTGGDCTTLRSEADWGRGTPQAAMCLLPRPPGGVSPLHGTIHIPPAPVAKWRRPPIPQAAHPRRKVDLPIRSLPNARLVRQNGPARPAPGGLLVPHAAAPRG